MVAFTLLGVADDRLRWWPPPTRDWIVPTMFNGEQIGQLGAGDARSLDAAVARLRIAGALEYDAATGALVATGQTPDDGGTPLSAALIAAVVREVPVHALPTDPGIRAALDEQRADLDLLLRNQGIATAWDAPDLPRSVLRREAVPQVALAVLGTVWVFLWSFRWYTDIPLALMVLLLWLVLTDWASPPRDMRPVARRAVDRVAGANQHLHPSMRPALTTYGPAAAALAVGLFGMEVLTPTDPALAATSTDTKSDRSHVVL
ncbi:hypothetical protein GCM10009557_95550 [Virgisporangium ochraceum]